MTDYIDYKIGPDWDMEFTEWDDLAVVRDNRVLLQNFVLLAEEYVRPYVGETITNEDEVRLANRLERAYEQRSYVEECTVYEFDVTDNELSFTVLINSDEYDWQGAVAI